MTNKQSIDRNHHSNFLKRELVIQKLDFEKTLETQALVLREKGELYVSQFAGIDDARGLLVLKFSSKRPIPRKDEHLVAFIPQPQYLNMATWMGKSYNEIRQSPHRVTEVKSIWIKFDEETDKYLIGFSGAELSFASDIPRNTPVVLGPEEPPLDYLENMARLVQSGHEPEKVSEVLDIEIGEENWCPEPLVNDENAICNIHQALSENDDVIVQGPPGTGKTYLMAAFCSAYLNSGKTVLVTALTNRALVELASKESLKALIDQERIFKMNLSSDEKKKLKGVQGGRDYTGAPGTMLLATYYSMSQMALDSYSGKQYDLVLIEEASQSFLSTIAAARKLGKKCIIIGDQRQLQPITSQQIEDDDDDEYNLRFAVSGLNTICNHFLKAKQYILTHTFRLNQPATVLTNLFYDEGDLVSVKQTGKEILINDPIRTFFPKQPGIKLNLVEFNPDSKAPPREIDQIAQIVVELYKNNQKIEIAVLSYYKETVRALQKLIYPKVKNAERITVETVDRIQGMTTDVCIYFIPFVGFNRSLDPHRFNVATSRALEYTLVIAHNGITSYRQLPAKVKAYITSLVKAN